MGDWKERTVGESYSGPSDETMLIEITCLGKRSKCTYSELLRRFGTHHKARLDRQLERMVSDGKLVRLDERELYYCVPNK